MKKTILITGGTSGIGLASAAYLINTGYNVLITGRSAENLRTAKEILGHQVHTYLCDAVKISDIEHLAEAIQKDHQRLDGIFINAGVYQSSALSETSERFFDEMMNINFKGAFFTIQKLLPLLNLQSSIVLNTTLLLEKAFANASVYIASKAALDAIANVLNIELADREIRVNIISPGTTITPIQEKAGMNEEDMVNFYAFGESSPLGRMIMPNDIAPVVEFLMSDKSIAMRGVRLGVDGGITA